MISPEQCRAARALLNWTQAELAERVSISAVSIRAFEKGGEMRDSNLKLLRMTFEAAGVTFIPENGGGAGVRLSEPKGTKRA
jgi:transcriptional regulator with XRE-family HTH domain